MRIQYAVLRVPQYMPVRPLWGGLMGVPQRMPYVLVGRH
jgi:hypothetical protein